MYPTAYTLTVLVLTLLQYSFDKRYTRNLCLGGAAEQDSVNSTMLCNYNVLRKEIRQLNRHELESFIQVFNEYSAMNDTEELNSNIVELGVVQVFDELLQSRGILTPYWEYRFDLSEERPESSSLWSAPQFQAIKEATDAQWLTEFIENESAVEDDEFFGDDPFSRMWKRRRSALRMMRKLKNTDVFWHLLLLVSIETGMDQIDRESFTHSLTKKISVEINRTSCIRDYGKFTRWINESCQVSLRAGETCGVPGDCFSRRCSKNVCASTKHLSANTSTPIPSTTRPSALNVAPITPATLEVAEKEYDINGTVDEIDENATMSPAEIENISTMNESVVTSTNEILTSTTVQSTSDLPRYLFKLEPPKGHRQDKTDMTNSVSTDTDYQPQTKVPVTTEFLATELTTPSPKRKSYRERGRKNKYAPTTTPKPREQIPGTDVYHAPTSPIFDDSALSSGANSQVDNSPVDQENYSKDTLDALLVYLPTPKVPEMIAWTSKIPIRMAYFGFTIIEGSLGKQRRLKEKGHRRAKGARIYVRGLGMPVGYTQVTQGRQMRSGIGALARVLDPDNNEPFVEFKMRVENRYGTPCKQMCLDPQQRYRRCARRTVRLSPYKKFSDPIPYFESESLATNGQFRGKGYYKKRKLTYLLFKCE